jgi:hypothetical protein
MRIGPYAGVWGRVGRGHHRQRLPAPMLVALFPAAGQTKRRRSARLVRLRVAVDRPGRTTRLRKFRISMVWCSAAFEVQGHAFLRS